jgi:hypothetical protein
MSARSKGIIMTPDFTFELPLLQGFFAMLRSSPGMIIIPIRTLPLRAGAMLVELSTPGGLESPGLASTSLLELSGTRSASGNGFEGA